VIALYGGAFDPPHNGHVALLEAARRALDPDECMVAVTAVPPHKEVGTPSVIRMELAKAAFPGETVMLDEHGRTIDLLRAHPEWTGAIFLIGADEFVDFPEWKEPESILELVRIGVATRPGFSSDRIAGALKKIGRRDRVELFDMEPVAIASRDLRARLDRGDDVHELVPEAVWDLIERGGLYGRRYTELA
jgi:nicotinate-nucleotide adenylyltransferase